MNRREYLLGTIAALGGGYALWDIGVLSAPDGVKLPETTQDETVEEQSGTTGSTTEANNGGFLEPTDWSATPKLTHESVNAFRKAQGRNVLRWSPALGKMAQSWAEQMATTGNLEHRSGSLIETAEEFGVMCDTSGENIAQTWVKETVDVSYGGSERYTAPDELATGLVESWKHSEGHRENMLRVEYTQSGVGVMVDDDKVWAVQNFC